MPLLSWYEDGQAGVVSSTGAVTGPQGPQGSAGPAGPAGPAGAAGATGPVGASPFTLSGGVASYAGEVDVGSLYASNGSNLQGGVSMRGQITVLGSTFNPLTISADTGSTALLGAFSAPSASISGHVLAGSFASLGTTTIVDGNNLGDPAILTADPTGITLGRQLTVTQPASTQALTCTTLGLTTGMATGLTANHGITTTSLSSSQGMTTTTLGASGNVSAGSLNVTGSSSLGSLNAQAISVQGVALNLYVINLVSQVLAQ